MGFSKPPPGSDLQGKCHFADSPPPGKRVKCSAWAKRLGKAGRLRSSPTPPMWAQTRQKSISRRVSVPARPQSTVTCRELMTFSVGAANTFGSIREYHASAGQSAEANDIANRGGRPARVGRPHGGWYEELEQRPGCRGRCRVRRHPISVGGAFRGGAPGLLRGGLDRGYLGIARDVRRALLGAHLRHRRRISPVLFASSLFDQPRVSIPAGRIVAEHGTEERPVGGIQAPSSSPALRYRARRALSAPPRIRVQPSGLDFLAETRQSRLREGGRLQPLSRIDVAA